MNESIKKYTFNVLFQKRLFALYNGNFEKYFVIAPDIIGHKFHKSDSLKSEYQPASDVY